jgi:hypothetical protein
MGKYMEWNVVYLVGCIVLEFIYHEEPQSWQSLSQLSRERTGRWTEDSGRHREMEVSGKFLEDFLRFLLDPILSKMNPIYILNILFNICFNAILEFALFGFSDYKCMYRYISHVCYNPCSFNILLFVCYNSLWWRRRFIKLLIKVKR